MNRDSLFGAATWLAAALAGSVILDGCATAGPTPQLVEARDAYDGARTSRAAQLMPAEVLAARQALERAEAAQDDDPGSEYAEHMAYLAERRAELAVARADRTYHLQRAQGAERQYAELQQQLRQQAQQQLAQTRDALNETQSALAQLQASLSAQGGAVKGLEERRAELEARKQQLEARQAELESQLATERAAREEAQKARLAAEERARLALQSLQEIAQVKEEARETTITLSGSVLFKTGESTLLPIAREHLTAVAKAIKEQGDDKPIIIEGHTDSVGNEQMNQQLSLARAQAVRAFLTEQGMKPERIQAVGKGESEPVADNDTPDGRANNRRVEIVITK